MTILTCSPSDFAARRIARSGLNEREQVGVDLGLRAADSWRRRSSPLIFDDNYQPQPAYDAVIAAGKRASP